MPVTKESLKEVVRASQSPKGSAGGLNVKIVVGLLGVITTLGAVLTANTKMVQDLLGSSASANSVSEVVQFRKDFDTHTQLPGHPVDHALQGSMADDIREIKADVKELLKLRAK